MYTKELYHHGILGMHWGIRRYQPYSEVPRGSGKGGKEIGLAKKAKGPKSDKKASSATEMNDSSTQYSYVLNDSDKKELANKRNKLDSYTEQINTNAKQESETAFKTASFKNELEKRIAEEFDDDFDDRETFDLMVDFHARDILVENSSKYMPKTSSLVEQRLKAYNEYVDDVEKMSDRIMNNLVDPKKVTMSDELKATVQDLVDGALLEESRLTDLFESVGQLDDVLFNVFDVGDTQKLYSFDDYNRKHGH